MALRQHPLSDLRRFLPSDQAYAYIISLVDNQGINLEIKKERKSIYGNFKIEYGYKPSIKITINGNLPPYQFFLTLLHEIAHYYTAVSYGPKVKPHGKEWKRIFSGYLKYCLSNNLFPKSVAGAVEKYAASPKASSCTDTELQIALYKLENEDSLWTLLDLANMRSGISFETKDGHSYEYLKKLKKNHLLRSLINGAEYIAPPTLEIHISDEPQH